MHRSRRSASSTASVRCSRRRRAGRGRPRVGRPLVHHATRDRGAAAVVRVLPHRPRRHHPRAGGHLAEAGRRLGALPAGPAVAVPGADEVDLLPRALAHVAEDREPGGAVQAEPERAAQARGIHVALRCARLCRVVERVAGVAGPVTSESKHLPVQLVHVEGPQRERVDHVVDTVADAEPDGAVGLHDDRTHGVHRRVSRCLQQGALVAEGHRVPCGVDGGCPRTETQHPVGTRARGRARQGPGGVDEPAVLEVWCHRDAHKTEVLGGVHGQRGDLPWRSRSAGAGHPLDLAVLAGREQALVGQVGEVGEEVAWPRARWRRHPRGEVLEHEPAGQGGGRVSALRGEARQDERCHREHRDGGQRHQRTGSVRPLSDGIPPTPRLRHADRPRSRGHPCAAGCGTD